MQMTRRGAWSSCGGRDRRRSGDLPLFRRTLCQLSYPTACLAPAPPVGAKMAVLTGFEPATSGLTGRRALQTAPQDQCTPNGIRSRVTALKGRRPGPLDDGGSTPPAERRNTLPADSRLPNLDVSGMRA